MPDLDAFPRRAWTAAVRHALANHSDLWCPDVGGRLELRARLLEYLARARGVVGSPDDVIVCSGFTQGFALVATALCHLGVHAVAVEDPSRPLNIDTLVAAGLEVIPVSVDDQGLRIDLIPETVGAVVVTPAHQIPTGVVLSAERRTHLIAQANEHGMLVIEDDYMGESRSTASTAVSTP